MSYNPVAPPLISIFRVPKEIVDTKPEAYIPKRVGLGPYNHFRSEVQKFLRHKLAAIKRILTTTQITNFQSLVIGMLLDLEPNIRACYNEHLDLDGDMLAWIMAIDGLFLLSRLGYALTLNSKFHKPQEDGGHVTGGKHSLDALPNDDNNAEISILNEEIEVLESVKISWKDMVKFPQERVIHPRGILMLENQIPFFVLNELLKALHLSARDDSLHRMLAAYGETLSPFQMTPQVKFHQDDSPAHLLDYMYRLIVSNIKPQAQGKWQDFKPKELDGKTQAEIPIPSVKDLYEAAGITFGVTDGGICDVRYDEKDFIFYLPKINLESNSDVILRNMLAYEQAIGTPGSIFVLTEYVELMCGIIDTVTDVDMLRERGVITGNLNNGEIVNIFNGIPRCSNIPVEVSSIRIAFSGVMKQLAL